MKSFKTFCEDVNIQEFWNPFAPKVKPSPQPVLAYKNYQQGFGVGKNWKPGITSQEFGKQKVYVKTEPTVAKTTPILKK